MNIHLFLSTFGLIFLAELPDKTTLAVLYLASRQNPGGVLCGAAAALFIQSMIAVLLGSLLALLPPHIVRVLAGLLFCIFAIAILLKKEEAAELAPASPTRLFWKAAATAFVVIFLAEWGDLTQLATATMAARYRAPVTIFAAATLALWSVAGLGVTLGHGARRRFKPERLKYIAAASFAIVGIVLLVRR